MADITKWASKRQNLDGVFTIPIPILPVNQFYALFKTTGGSGDMNVDGSPTAGAVEFNCVVAPGKVLLIEDVAVLIVDGGISPTKFGGIDALTNGIKIEVIDSDDVTVLVEFTADVKIKKNADWALLADTDRETTAVAGDDTEEIQWSLSSESGAVLLTEGQFFRFTVQDDLSEITEMRVMAHGDIFDAGVFTDLIPRLSLGSYT